MAYSIIGKNAMLNALGALAVKAALYSADPGATGILNELTGGTPAYARQTIAWSAAGDGTMNLNGTAIFDVPAGATVLYVGFWNSAGTAYYGASLVTQEDFAGQGTYTFSDADLDLNA